MTSTETPIQKKGSITDWFIRLVKGIIIGVGFITPGLSGGVLAVVDALPGDDGGWYAVSESLGVSSLGWTPAARWSASAEPAPARTGRVRPLILDRAAAQILRDQGQWAEAAALYLEADEPGEAATLYAQLGDLATALDLRRASGDRRGEADLLCQQNKPADAAPIYEEIGAIDLAVQAYVASGRTVYACLLYTSPSPRDS